jgi:zona occludens toxin (predicted ATPase)
VILPSLEKGLTVLSNIPMNADLLASHSSEIGLAYSDLFVPVSNDEFQSGEICLQYPGAVVVADECRKFFPAGLTQKDIPPAWDRFLAEHRHFADDETGWTSEIVLVTQDLGQIAKCVRRLVEKTVIHEKLNSVGLSKYFRATVFDGAMEGKGTATAKRGSERGKYEESVGRWYQSHTQAKQGVSVVEEAPDDRGSIFRSAGFKGVVVLVFVGVLGFYFGLRPFLFRGVEDAEAGDVEPSMAGHVQVAPVRVEPEPFPAAEPEPERVEVPKLSGFVRAPGVCFGFDLDGVRVDLDAEQCDLAAGRRVVAQRRVEPDRSDGSALGEMLAFGGRDGR